MAVTRTARSFLVHSLIALLALAVTPTGAAAGQIGLAKALAKFTLQNKSTLLDIPQTATDFHLVLHSDTENLTVKSIDGGTFTGHGTTGAGTHDLTIDFAGGEVPAGNPLKDTNTFEVVLEQKENTIRIKKANWTGTLVHLGDLTLDDALIPGFKVEGDPVYTIFNDMEDPFGIRDLQFLINVPEMADADLIPGVTPGFGSPLPDFILPPGGFLTLNLAGTIDPGNYLYAQMSLFDATTGDTTGAMIQGHQAAPVPEPTTLVLLGVGLAAATVRRRKR